ncbi:MAG: hypothetical protein ACKERG_00985 [Candidatus Hodgkinia cicadicola]
MLPPPPSAVLNQSTSGSLQKQIIPQQRRLYNTESFERWYAETA